MNQQPQTPSSNRRTPTGGPPADEGQMPRGQFPDLVPVSILAVVGAVLLVFAWLLPAFWKSLAPSVVERAGKGTPTVAELGIGLVDVEKVGPATVVLAAAQSVNDPQAPKLAAAIATAQARKPALALWGGNDRRLETIFKPGTLTVNSGNSPVLELFLNEPARAALREHLSRSASPGVQAILRTRELTGTTSFVPATKPGGQPFEATILLAGLLVEGENVPASLAQEMKSLADSANESHAGGGWENYCLDLLSLGKRLNWTQLVELLRYVPDTQTLSGFAQVAKGSSEQFPIAYASALLAQSGSGVAAYLVKYDKRGGDHLAMALEHGQGAVRLLLDRQLPLYQGSKAMAFAAPLVMKAPRLAALLKILGFIGAVLCFYFVWNELSAVESVEGLSVMSPALRLRRGAVALLLAVLLIATSEPLGFTSTGVPLYRAQIKIPVLSNSPVPKEQSAKTRKPRMNLDLSTILSVALFAALQIIVYSICLMKIQEIDRQHGPAQLKLKLMENEENLFDSGLYVGIAGTAAALILQVLQIIEANLLAAYASNLFGILCVALVKIRHVRAYKRKLILRMQVEAAEREPAAQAVA